MVNVHQMQLVPEGGGAGLHARFVKEGFGVNFLKPDAHLPIGNYIV